MIKLIASDLDGTLLLPDGSLPEETFAVIQALHARGILFCVASGRQYESLKRLFAPVADKVLFIAENGALVFYKDVQLLCETLPAATLPKILFAIREETAVHPLLCCADYAYAQDEHPAFLTECAKYYPHFKRINLLQDAPEKNRICKIALFDERGTTTFKEKRLAELLPECRVTISGKSWTDISMPETNKGKAMRFIQNYFAIQSKECMAFGDYMNDLELLLACEHAYVTDNGFTPLKERIGNVIPSNAEKGVIQTINKLLQGIRL